MNRLRYLACKKLFERSSIDNKNTTRPTRACLALAGIACLSAFDGCGATRTGPRIDLAQAPVASIALSLPKGSTLAPGAKSPLVVKLTQPDGTVLTTEGEGRGKVRWKDLTVAADIVAIDKNGLVSAPKDPKVSDGRTGRVKVSVPSHPEIHGEIEVVFRYDMRFRADFFGSDGLRGTDGVNGIDGASGSSGSLDPNHPSPGGRGSDGTNGTNGGNGWPGSDGPPVQVLLTRHPSSQAGGRVLLEASVSEQGRPFLLRQTFYLIDPHGGSFTVRSNGGHGGEAGRGGRGGRGGSGGTGTPNGDSGRDGFSGTDGMRGRDGQGGLITVIYDPSAAPYLSALHVSSLGPTPVFRESRVDPLW
jgi:hypothetical protein